MGHPYTITQVSIDNISSSVIANNTIKQQQSLAIYMRYFWSHDQKTLRTFLIASKQDKKIFQTNFKNTILKKLLEVTSYLSTDR